MNKETRPRLAANRYKWLRCNCIAIQSVNGSIAFGFDFDCVTHHFSDDRLSAANRWRGRALFQAPFR